MSTTTQLREINCAVLETIVMPRDVGYSCERLAGLFRTRPVVLETRAEVWISRKVK